MRKNILITGEPGSGKSTLLQNIIANIPSKVGFLTKEIRAEGVRTGFMIETHKGTRAVLATVDKPTPHKFSKYYVNVDALDAIIPGVATFGPNDILYLDEIAPLELFSEKFKQLTLQYLDSPNICLATIKQGYVDEFVNSIKHRPDVQVIEISETTRDEKKELVEQLIKDLTKSQQSRL